MSEAKKGTLRVGFDRSLKDVINMKGFKFRISYAVVWLDGV